MRIFSSPIFDGTFVCVTHLASLHRKTNTHSYSKCATNVLKQICNERYSYFWPLRLNEEIQMHDIYVVYIFIYMQDNLFFFLSQCEFHYIKQILLPRIHIFTPFRIPCIYESNICV